MSMSALFIPHPHKHLSFGCGTATKDAVNVSLYLLNSFLGAPNTEDAHRLETWETDRLVLCIPTAPCHPTSPWSTSTPWKWFSCTAREAVHPSPLLAEGVERKGFGAVRFSGVVCASGRRYHLYSHSELDAGFAGGVKVRVHQEMGQ